MEDATLPSHSSMSLICRLDHLEFIIKYLERKHRGEVGAYAEKHDMPLDSTTKETYFKGSLSDRVASLEQRLFQLCLEMDSCSSSYLMTLASTQTSGESSSSQSTNTEIFYSFPTFNIPQHKPISHTPINTLDHFQGKSKREEQHQMKNGSPAKEKEEKERGKRNEKKSKGGKKRVPSPWLHFKLLGC